MSAKNPAASVRQRLLELSRQTGEDFQQLLTRYALERLLYRLGTLELAERFILKGAMLFALWTGRMHRPTRDLDLLGFGDRGGEALAAVFREICTVEASDDGLLFLPDTIVVQAIREDQEYGGQRVGLEVRLGNARLRLQIDIGFGDAVTPAAETVDYPTLLAMSPPRIRAYPRETVVAEKLHAMVERGMANSRLKDFYDLDIIQREFAFSGANLSRAMAATFGRRGTPIPETIPVALTEEFGQDDLKRKQWQAFLVRGGLRGEERILGQILTGLSGFLVPPLLAAAKEERFLATWQPGGPWEMVSDGRRS